MDLHTGLLYWPTTLIKPIHTNPRIKSHYDTIIIGAGMSGILTAKTLGGQHPTEKNHYYLLGFSGNGTVYSMLGAEILADLVMGRENNDTHIVTLDRKYGLK